MHRSGRRLAWALLGLGILAAVGCASVLGFDRATLDDDRVDAGNEASPDRAAQADAAQCITDDFNRKSPGGQPWDELDLTAGQTDIAAGILDTDAGHAFGVLLANTAGQAPKDRRALLNKTFPSETTFAELTFDQALEVDGSVAGNWATSIAIFSVEETGALTFAGAELLNGDGGLGGARVITDGGAGGTSSGPVAASVGPSGAATVSVRLTVTFGEKGTIALVAQGNESRLDFRTNPGQKSLSLGLFTLDATPQVAILYSNVRLCWR